MFCIRNRNMYIIILKTNIVRQKPLAKYAYGPENVKKPRPKKNTWNQINQFHDFFFDQIPFFEISKMAKNQFLNW